MTAKYGNTIGVFLDTLSKDGQAASPNSGSTRVTNILELLRKYDGRAPLRELAARDGSSPGDFMDAVFSARDKQLLTIAEYNGEQIVELTSLGRAFTPA